MSGVAYPSLELTILCVSTSSSWYS